jgi:hypothetical protein
LTRVKKTERPVLGSNISQQAPQEVELNPSTIWDPAIAGKLGRSPKVGKPLVMRPFSPVEQAVVARLVDPTQKRSSKLMVVSKGGWATATIAEVRATKMAVNFIVEMSLSWLSEALDEFGFFAEVLSYGCGGFYIPPAGLLRVLGFLSSSARRKVDSQLVKAVQPNLIIQSVIIILIHFLCLG